MADVSGRISVGIDESLLERQIRKTLNKNFAIKVSADGQNQFSGLSKDVFQFNKSLQVAESRVLAFGTTAGILYSVIGGFRELLNATLSVEQKLTDINVLLNLSSNELNKFGNSLFSIAKNTAQSFDQVAEIALEFSRQGLGVEETLKRTESALILVRQSGLDTAKSVGAITAAINSFTSEALTAAEVTNRFAAVDQKFAVSSRDLAEAVSRVGSTAQDAGVNLNELLGIVTAVQQTTSRGGAVIGNALKTIFTRLGNSDSIASLRELGVEIDRNQTGLQKLQAIAKAVELNPQYANEIKRVAGGVYQINIVSAALQDLQNEYGITAQAIDTANNAQNQAFERNERQNKTLATTLNATRQNLIALGSVLGQDLLGPGIENIFGGLNRIFEDFKDVDPDSFKAVGLKVGQGIVSGLGEYLAGPGAAVATVIAGKLIGSFVNQATKAFSLKNTFNRNADDSRGETVVKSVDVLSRQPQIVDSVLNGTISLQQAEQRVLDIILKENAARERQLQIISKIASAVVSGSPVVPTTPITPSRPARRASSGLIPDYAQNMERIGAEQGGYKAGKIKSTRIKGLGEVIYNDAEDIVKFPGMDQPAIIPPQNSKAGKNYKKNFEKKLGFNPYKAEGLVPNYADLKLDIDKLRDIGAGSQKIAYETPSKRSVIKLGRGGELPQDSIDRIVSYTNSANKVFEAAKYPLNALKVRPIKVNGERGLIQRKAEGMPLGDLLPGLVGFSKSDDYYDSFFNETGDINSKLKLKARDAGVDPLKAPNLDFGDLNNFVVRTEDIPKVAGILKKSKSPKRIFEELRKENIKLQAIDIGYSKGFIPNFAGLGSPLLRAFKSTKSILKDGKVTVSNEGNIKDIYNYSGVGGLYDNQIDEIVLNKSNLIGPYSASLIMAHEGAHRVFGRYDNERTKDHVLDQIRKGVDPNLIYKTEKPKSIRERLASASVSFDNNTPPDVKNEIPSYRRVVSRPDLYGKGSIMEEMIADDTLSTIKDRETLSPYLGLDSRKLRKASGLYRRLFDASLEGVYKNKQLGFRDDSAPNYAEGLVPNFLDTSLLKPFRKVKKDIERRNFSISDTKNSESLKRSYGEKSKDIAGYYSNNEERIYLNNDYIIGKDASFSNKVQTLAHEGVHNVIGLASKNAPAGQSIKERLMAASLEFDSKEPKNSKLGVDTYIRTKGSGIYPTSSLMEEALADGIFKKPSKLAGAKGLSGWDLIDEASSVEQQNTVNKYLNLSDKQKSKIGSLRDRLVKSSDNTLKKMGVNYFNQGMVPKVPNYNNLVEYSPEVRDAISREREAGVPLSLIKLGKDNRIKSKDNPGGIGVYNSIHEPNGLKQGIARAQTEKRDPKTYGVKSSGFIPNFADSPSFTPSGFLDKDIAAYKASIRDGTAKQKDLTKFTGLLGKTYSLTEKEVSKLNDNLSKSFDFYSDKSGGTPFRGTVNYRDPEVEKPSTEKTGGSLLSSSEVVSRRYGIETKQPPAPQPQKPTPLKSALEVGQSEAEKIFRLNNERIKEAQEKAEKIVSSRVRGKFKPEEIKEPVSIRPLDTIIKSSDVIKKIRENDFSEISSRRLKSSVDIAENIGKVERPKKPVIKNAQKEVSKIISSSINEVFKPTGPISLDLSESIKPSGPIVNSEISGVRSSSRPPRPIELLKDAPPRIRSITNLDEPSGDLLSATQTVQVKGSSKTKDILAYQEREASIQQSRLETLTNIDKIERGLKDTLDANYKAAVAKIGRSSPEAIEALRKSSAVSTFEADAPGLNPNEVTGNLKRAPSINRPNFGLSRNVPSADPLKRFRDLSSNRDSAKEVEKFLAQNKSSISELSPLQLESLRQDLIKGDKSAYGKSITSSPFNPTSGSFAALAQKAQESKSLRKFYESQQEPSFLSRVTDKANRFGNAGLQIGFLAPIVSEVSKSFIGEDTLGKRRANSVVDSASNILSFGATGASLGLAFGGIGAPVGAAIGATTGAIISVNDAIKNWNNTLPELEKRLIDISRASEESNNGLKLYYDSTLKLKAVMEGSVAASKKQLDELEEQRSKGLSQSKLSDEQINRIRSSNFDSKTIIDIIGENSRFNSSREDAAKTSVNLAQIKLDPSSLVKSQGFFSLSGGPPTLKKGSEERLSSAIETLLDVRTKNGETVSKELINRAGPEIKSSNNDLQSLNILIDELANIGLTDLSSELKTVSDELRKSVNGNIVARGIGKAFRDAIVNRENSNIVNKGSAQRTQDEIVNFELNEQTLRNIQRDFNLGLTEDAVARRTSNKAAQGELDISKAIREADFNLLAASLSDLDKNALRLRNTLTDLDDSFSLLSRINADDSITKARLALQDFASDAVIQFGQIAARASSVGEERDSINKRGIGLTTRAQEIAGNINSPEDINRATSQLGALLSDNKIKLNNVDLGEGPQRSAIKEEIKLIERTIDKLNNTFREFSVEDASISGTKNNNEKTNKIIAEGVENLINQQNNVNLLGGLRNSGSGIESASNQLFNLREDLNISNQNRDLSGQLDALNRISEIYERINVELPDAIRKQLIEATTISIQRDVSAGIRPEPKDGVEKLAVDQVTQANPSNRFGRANVPIRPVIDNSISDRLKNQLGLFTSIEDREKALAELSKARLRLNREIANEGKDFLQAQNELSEVAKVQLSLQKQFSETYVVLNNVNDTIREQADLFADVADRERFIENIDNSRLAIQRRIALNITDGLKAQKEYNALKAEELAIQTEIAFKANRVGGDAVKSANNLRRLTKLNNTGSLSGGDIGEAFGDQFKYNTLDLYGDLNRAAIDFGVTFQDSIKAAFAEFQDGTKSAKEALTDLGLSLARNIGNKAFDIGLNNILGSTLGSINFKNKGGMIKRFSSGGEVTGGSGVKDDVKALLTDGEYVIKKSSVQKYGVDFLDRVNEKKVFYDGETSAISSNSNSFNSVLANTIKLDNEVNPTKGTTIIDPNLSSFAFEDENNPQNARRIRREELLGQYIRRNREIIDAYNKRKNNALNGALVQAGISLVGIGIGAATTGAASKSAPIVSSATNNIIESTAYSGGIRYNENGIGGGFSINPNNPSSAYGLSSYDNLKYDKVGTGYNPGGIYAPYGRAKGGKIKRYAYGGNVFGNDSYSDRVPALLTDGEYVIKKDTVKSYGEKFFNDLNNKKINKFALGGPVGMGYSNSVQPTNYNSSAIDELVLSIESLQSTIKEFIDKQPVQATNVENNRSTSTEVSAPQFTVNIPVSIYSNNGQSSQNGGGNNGNNQNDNRENSRDKNRENSENIKAFSKQMEAIARKKIADEMAPGGLLQDVTRIR